MHICIVATICKESGALSIYNQMIEHLKNERRVACFYTIFVDPNMPTPDIENVCYILYSTSGSRRIKFDYYDFKRICAENHIAPDVIFSLNNTGVRYAHVRQVIYYHQSLPLYKYHFSLFDKKERAIFLFKIYFPFFVKQSLKWTTTLIVQTNIIRNLFSKRFHFPLDRIEIAFPDMERLNPDSVPAYPFEKEFYHFIYPATVVGYKEHTTIARTLMVLNNKTYLDKIKIHLTLKEGEHEKLQSLICLAGLENNFVFHGPMPHEELLSMYKSADALLFPSVIETIGLPLLEAAGFGLPVLANDLEFVKDVLTGYDGLMTVPLRDYCAWGKAIEKICIERPHYKSYHRPGGSDWPNVFKLIHGEQDK